jgi:hypothetical protein
MNVNKLAYFSKVCYQIKFYSSVLSGARVIPTSEVCMAVMYIIQGMELKITKVDDLCRHHVQIKSHETLSVILKLIKEGQMKLFWIPIS